MSENNLGDKKGGNKLATYAAATLIAGAVGFLAIYVTFGSHYNEEPKTTQQIAQLKAAKNLKKLTCPRSPKPGRRELYPFNCGDMISFLISKKQPILNNIEFLNGAGELTSLDK